MQLAVLTFKAINPRNANRDDAYVFGDLVSLDFAFGDNTVLAKLLCDCPGLPHVNQDAGILFLRVSFAATSCDLLGIEQAKPAIFSRLAVCLVAGKSNRRPDVLVDFLVRLVRSQRFVTTFDRLLYRDIPPRQVLTMQPAV